ncbi:MAG: CPBP family intramembrane metalloprotease [Lachnospiraceae bacterium]|nr:CPBP family intramembrane metalloprotease [Lachnospiraceae bacterium]
MEKKKLWIYIIVAFMVAYAMNLLMIIGLKKNYDLTAFVNTQMMYPACGVILGKLLCGNKEEKLPRAGYITVLVTTAVMMAISLCSLAFYLEPLEMNGVRVDIWNMASSSVLSIGSLIAYVLFWTCGKEKRSNAGLQRKNMKMSILMVVLFIALFFGRMIFSVYLRDLTEHTTENWDTFLSVLSDSRTWATIAVLPFSFFLSFIAFFGEEYGWRYYLQPVMQKKMGKRPGVLVLGLVWAVWHIGVDFMYYTKETGPQQFVAQIITCVVMAVFFGFAYMMTDNIWVVFVMHYLNNNLAAVFTGGGADALQNQVIPWSQIPILALSSVAFFLFILAPVYRKMKADPDQSATGLS